MAFENKFKASIPSQISAIRILLAVLFFLALNKDLTLAIIIFTAAMLTDALDGYTARKLDFASSAGAYLDVIADFILVSAGFLGLVSLGFYPFWVILLVVFMFLQFLATSKAQKPIYDPVGKYYGSFLFLVILTTLTLQNQFLNVILVILMVIFTIISLSSRLWFILHEKLL
jgi:CDP-diacylglycerol--glycerol-3-phosphate 3-phosphatidyltransferase/cardiolipin synthase